MFKEQKTNIFVPSILAVLVISLTTPVVQAALDINWIAITSRKNYVDGIPISAQPWKFEIWVENVDSWSLHHIDVTPPGSATPFTMFEDSGSLGWWRWDSPSWYSSLASLRVDYPEGIYTFDFRNISNVQLDTVSLNYSGLPGEPSMPVDFTYPSVDGQTGISTYPTFTWIVDAGAGDALLMGLGDDVTGDLYWDAPVSMTTSSWTPGSLQAGHGYQLSVAVLEVKDWVGPDWPTTTTTGGDPFAYSLINEYVNEINFTTIPAPLSGWVFMLPDLPDIGYSLDEGDLLCFFSFDFVQSFDIDAGEWSIHKPTGWIYIDWPFYDESDTGTLWFALPPAGGLWVYHFSTNEWIVSPQIIP
ncbi:MAG: hypothetical protein ACYS6K_20480 [Planctomycetota bacterium]|jgi:hypothetical protein